MRACVCVCLSQMVENGSLDVSDDEELREQLDMHSIIVSCVNEEPLFTAEQVMQVHTSTHTHTHRFSCN